MSDYDRFRSFAERYIIERASKFETGKEREQAWAATLDAKSIYQSIGRVAKDAEAEIPPCYVPAIPNVPYPPAVVLPYANALPPAATKKWWKP